MKQPAQPEPDQAAGLVGSRSMTRLALTMIALTSPAHATTVEWDAHGIAWIDGLGFRHESECVQLPMWQSRTTEWPRYECESLPFDGKALTNIAFTSAPASEPAAMWEPTFASRPSNQFTRPTNFPQTSHQFPTFWAPHPHGPIHPPEPPIVPLPASVWMLLAGLVALMALKAVYMPSHQSAALVVGGRAHSSH